MTNKTKKGASCIKTIAIIVATLAAAAAVAFAVYKIMQKKKAKSEVLGAVDIDGDGEADAIMLDTTGDGEVDTIVLNVEPTEESCEE